MSSYLNIYLKPKKKDSKPLLLISFSRSSDIYQAFYDNFNLYSSEGEKKEITGAMMNTVITDVTSEINKSRSRYESYLEAKEKADIEDIVSLKEYIHDLEYTKAQLDFLQEIVWSCENDYSNFEKVLTYID